MEKPRVLKHSDLSITVPAALAVVAVMVIGVFANGAMTSALGQLRSALSPVLAWYLPALVTVLLFMVLWLGLGRYRAVRLGGSRESPEFSTPAWLAMLFAAGTGVGLLFWSVAEPLLHFQSNPFVEDDAPESRAAVIAVRLTFLHWGLTGWAIFGMVGLVLAYFGFRHQQPLTPRSALRPLLGERVNRWPGDMVDTFAVLATIFGIVTTLGLGVKQMNTGLGWLLDIPDSTTTQIVIIAAITGVATLSVAAGVNRGTRMLSEANIGLSMLLLVTVLAAGPTLELLALLVQATGSYLQNLFIMNLWSGYRAEGNWQSKWTIFYWGWWIAWSPFVSTFIARISRGRTIREYVFGVLLVPSLISFVWIAILGGTALHQQVTGTADLIAVVQNNTAAALFHTLGALPMPQWLVSAVGALTLLMLAFYLITSVDPSTRVVAMLTSGGELNPPKKQRVAWGISNGTLTAVLLTAGGVQALQDAVVAASLPFSLILIAMLVGLVKALREEPASPRRGHKNREEQPMTANR